MMSQPQEVFDHRGHSAAIRRHFGAVGPLARLLVCLGSSVHPAADTATSGETGGITASSVVENERQFAATRLLMRITSRPASGRRRLIVIRGHPGGSGPLMAERLPEVLHRHVVPREVAVVTGWSRRMICLERTGVRPPRVVAVEDVERVAARAHAASIEVGRHLLAKVSVLVLWDPLFEAHDAQQVTNAAPDGTEVFIINPGRRPSLTDAVNAVAGRQQPEPHLWGIDRSLARMLVLVLRPSSPVHSYSVTTVP